MIDDSSPNASANGTSNTENGTKKAQIHVVAQYIRDLSFECPNIETLLSGLEDSPNLNVEINVNAKTIDNNIYESAIELTANALTSEKTIYELELIYSGIFKLENLSKNSLEPVLLINCPTIIFPFMRRIVADITRENGFPPLFLDPLDFAGLYIKRQTEKI